jgi:hypothetical protein
VAVRAVGGPKGVAEFDDGGLRGVRRADMDAPAGDPDAAAGYLPLDERAGGAVEGGRGQGGVKHR